MCVVTVFSLLLPICVYQGAAINGEHPEGVNALMYGAAGAHMAVVQVCSLRVFS